MNKSSILLISALILSLASSRDLTIKCQSASTSECASGYKFVVTGTVPAGQNGTNLATKYCLSAGQSCNTAASSITVATAACARDYKNSNCTTGLCYTMTSNNNYCTKDVASCTANSTSYQYFCTNCGQFVNCAKCFSTSTNGGTRSAESCLGTTCSTVSANVTTFVEQCSTDYFGFPCSCCASSTSTLSVCSANNEAMSVQEIINWALGSTNNPNNPNNTNNNGTVNTNNFEFSVQGFVVLVLAIVFAFVI